jgi:hypothetical protein
MKESNIEINGAVPSSLSEPLVSYYIAQVASLNNILNLLPSISKRVV